jgi:hypothetical protein
MLMAEDEGAEILLLVHVVIRRLHWPRIEDNK